MKSKGPGDTMYLAYKTYLSQNPFVIFHDPAYSLDTILHIHRSGALTASKFCKSVVSPAGVR